MKGAKITTDQYLDKHVLKKLIAKKREPMFPDKSKLKPKQVKLVVEDTATHKHRDEVLTIEKQEKRSSTLVDQDSRLDMIQPLSPKKVNINSYSYMISEMRKKVNELDYVVERPEYERRRKRFFPQEKDDAERGIMQGVMHSIGIF